MENTTYTLEEILAVFDQDALSADAKDKFIRNLQLNKRELKRKEKIKPFLEYWIKLHVVKSWTTSVVLNLLDDYSKEVDLINKIIPPPESH